MKVKDESEWQGQLAEFANDPQAELAESVRHFIVTWADKAEEYLAQPLTQHASPMEALRASLIQVEREQGRIAIVFIGTALLLLCTHWAPAGEPSDFFEDMTTIEQHLFADVAEAKLGDLSKLADQGAQG